MKEIEELRNLSIDELQKKVLILREEQFKLRMQKANGVLEKPHLITLKRKSVARVKTLLSEKIKETEKVNENVSI